jgi:hypothetical protein
MACNGYATITRNNLSGMGLRPRLADYTHGSGPQDLQFQAAFHGEASDFAARLDYYVGSYYKGGGEGVNWFGQVGTCAGPPGEAHVRARALDITYVKISGGTNNFINMNTAWRPSSSLALRRAYIGVVAVARCYLGTVLTAWWNSLHENHIHIDNWSPTSPTPIRDDSKADTTLVQAACNFLNGAGIAIDGEWGNQTEVAFNSLKNQLDMQSFNIRGNVADAKSFLGRIAANGLENSPA